MPIFELAGVAPEFPADAQYWIAETAVVIGRVRLKSEVSLWWGAVLRGDNEWIEIGEGSQIQDNATLHTDPGFPMTIGRGCVIGHNVVLHGCTIGDNCLIGIAATVMEGAVIGANSIVAGHSYVADRTRIPANSVVMGTPARVVRSSRNFVANKLNAWLYHRNALAYARGDHRAWDGAEFVAAKEAYRRELERQVAATL